MQGFTPSSPPTHFIFAARHTVQARAPRTTGVLGAAPVDDVADDAGGGGGGGGKEDDDFVGSWMREDGGGCSGCCVGSAYIVDVLVMRGEREKKRGQREGREG